MAETSFRPEDVVEEACEPSGGQGKDMRQVYAEDAANLSILHDPGRQHPQIVHATLDTVP